MSDHSSPVARRATGKVLLAVLAGLCLLPSVARSQSELDSVWIRRDPVNENLNGVAYGLSRFIAVGNHGYWFTSPNAQTWTVRAPLTDGDLNAIHFAGGRFVAVGDGIYTSINGVSWEKASLAYSRLFLSDVAADDAGTWFAVGRVIEANGSLGTGITFTSPDGVNWTRASLLGAPAKIAFGAGHWFGAGTAGSEGQEFGEQLLQWQDINNDPGSPAEWAWSPFFLDDFELPQPKGALIRFLNGRFVLAGKNSEDDPNGAHHVFTSTDGVNWPKGTVSNQGLPENGTNQPRFSFLRELAYGGGVYVGIAAGSQSFDSDYWFRADVMTSVDGNTWAFLADRTSLSTATVSRALTAITHANGQFVAVGYRGTSPLQINIVTSPEGETWTSRSYNPRVFQRAANETARALAAGDGLVVGVTAYGGAVVSLDNGITWGYADVTAGGLGLEAIAHGGGRFVAAGQQGMAYRSTDGFSWGSVQVPDAFYLWDVIHDGTRFVAVGQYRDAGNTVQRGIASRSTDGASWDTVQIPATSRLEEVAFGNGAYVALGGATVQVSADAIDWSTANGAPALTRIAFGGGRFLGVAGDPGNPQFHTSVDGGEWVLIEAADEFFFTPFFEVESLNYLNGQFVMGTSDMGVLFLDENDRWVVGGGPDRAAAVAFSGDTYVATSLWTYTLPEPEPPLDPPVFTWRREGEYLQLDLQTLLDHRYRLWQRSGLDEGGTWNAIETIDAQWEEWQFMIYADSFETTPQFYQISVEPPGTF